MVGVLWVIEKPPCPYRGLILGFVGAAINHVCERPEAALPCQVRVYPIGIARSPLLHDSLGQAAGLRHMVLVPGRDDTAFAHLLVRAML